MNNISKMSYNELICDFIDSKSREDIIKLTKRLDNLDLSDNTNYLQFLSHLEFPNIGNSSKLYIATDENKIYRLQKLK